MGMRSSRSQRFSPLWRTGGGAEKQQSGVTTTQRGQARLTDQPHRPSSLSQSSSVALSSLASMMRCSSGGMPALSSLGIASSLVTTPAPPLGSASGSKIGKASIQCLRTCRRRRNRSPRFCECEYRVGVNDADDSSSEGRGSLSLPRSAAEPADDRWPGPPCDAGLSQSVDLQLVARKSELPVAANQLLSERPSMASPGECSPTAHMYDDSAAASASIGCSMPSFVISAAITSSTCFTVSASRRSYALSHGKCCVSCWAICL
eukprot:4914688-Prymnesium_polylepis.4